MKTVKTSIGTVRRNTVKARLILFSVLAIALIVCSFFSEYLTPHDPYLQNLDIAKHRTKIVRQMRRQIYRQMKQKAE